MLNRFFMTALFLLWASSAIAIDFSYEDIKLGSDIKLLPENKYKCTPSQLLPVSGRIKPAT
jgi:hypothetical protein